MRQLQPTTSGRRLLMRGIAMLWFMAITVPVMFAGLGMAVDVTRITLAYRQMSMAADAAALAGAQQFAPDKAYLDTGAAHAAAVDSLCYSARVGAMPQARAGNSNQLQCGAGSASGTISANTARVQVTANYRVPDLMFLGYFGVMQGKDSSVTRTAQVCVPGATALGACVRPQA